MEGYRRKVAICGSQGLGRYIARAILDTGEWDLVILSRNPQPELTANGITVRAVDYSSVEAIAHVLRRQQVDTVISVIPDAEVQLNIIDACLVARVRRFVPAEFETSPDLRPLYDPSDKTTVWVRLNEVRTHLESTVFSCGLFMEYFAPGGWRACGSYGWNDGTFLLDIERKRAKFPVQRADDPSPSAVVCLTSAVDVGRFVAAALFLRSWPTEMKMFGDRLRLNQLLDVAEYVREREFKCKFIGEEEIEFQILRTADWRAQSELQTMRSILASEYDIGHRDLNAMFPDIRPTSFKNFLRQHW